MAIGTAVQRGSLVFIYNEKSQQIGSISAGMGPGDGLVGFTSTTVSVRRGSLVFLYNERGSQIGSVPAR